MAAISSIQSVPGFIPEVQSISAYEPCSFDFTAGNFSLQRFKTDFHCKMKFLCLLFVVFFFEHVEGMRLKSTYR